MNMTTDQVEHVYNALDCCVTHEIFTAQEKNLDATAAATEQFSYALAAPIMEMSLRGVRVYEYERRKTVETFLREHAKIKRNLKRIVEEGIGFLNFNYNSPTQVSKLFYDVMGFKEIKGRSSAGVWSRKADRDALERLQTNWLALPICKHIIALRELDKKINFLETPRDDDGRFRTSYNIAGTNTGRLSSSENDFGTGSNSQNIDRRLRKVFIPDKGYKFCNVDLEQADARNVGAICWQIFVESHGEEFAGSYLDACESGDLHTTVCRMAWKDLDWGDDPSLWRSVADRIAYREFSYRDMSKKLGHGTNYYETPRTGAQHAKVSTSTVAAFQEKYFDAFPVIGDKDHTEPEWNNGRYEYANWHQYVRTKLEHEGSLTTHFFNRRRFFYGRPEDGTTLRAAIAYEPQSMTADEIDTGIINLWRYMPEIQILLQVHDSILFQYPEELEDEIIPKALEHLTIRMELKRDRSFYVPVEAKIGWNWSDESADNPYGLVKWKGPGADARKRPEHREIAGFKLNDILDA